jgi:biopolymer transport protein ExbD
VHKQYEVPDQEEMREIAPVTFRSGDDSEERDLDMTPMVDITFLLLIFFMVTAAFSLQKSLKVPTPDPQDESARAQTLEEIEENDDYVIVRIDEDDTIWVNESEAPSEQELLTKLREARQALPGTGSVGASSMLVLADGDCRHETVVMVLDAGNAVGMENVRLATGDTGGF